MGLTTRPGRSRTSRMTWVRAWVRPMPMWRSLPWIQGERPTPSRCPDDAQGDVCVPVGEILGAPLAAILVPPSDIDA